MTQLLAQQENEWFIPDTLLKSYTHIKDEYSFESFLDDKIKWHNFQLNMPQETDQERKEKEQAINQQVKLGIIRVQQHPQPSQIQQKPVPSTSYPSTVLDPRLLQYMGVFITPAFICKLNGKDVDMMTSLPVTDNTIKIEQPKSIIENIIESVTEKPVSKPQLKQFDFIKNKKIGRNDPCPCQSGKKYKICHGR